jgi:hypothetical protein
LWIAQLFEEYREWGAEMTKERALRFAHGLRLVAEYIESDAAKKPDTDPNQADEHWRDE